MKRTHGFTLVELLVVIAVIGILASILLPTLAKAKMRAQSLYCLSNTKQFVQAWAQYADDHNGQLACNYVASPGMHLSSMSTPLMGLNWVNNVLDWEALGNSDNTNAAKLVQSGLGPYLAAAAIYRCPSDIVLSSDQQKCGWSARVRSYSMNAMLGDAGVYTMRGYNEKNADYEQYFKYESIRQPANTFVFLDENADTISDGFFINNADSIEWKRLPGSYHDGAANFSFVDGHAEAHRWQYASTKVAPRGIAPSAPYVIPAKEAGDFYWIVSRMSLVRYGDQQVSNP